MLTFVPIIIILYYCAIVDGVLSPMITISSVTSQLAALRFTQPQNSLLVDIYSVILTSTCSRVPTRTGSTTSDSVTFDNLRAGIQYSVSVTGRNNMTVLEGTGTTTLNTSETGRGVNYYIIII